MTQSFQGRGYSDNYAGAIYHDYSGPWVVEIGGASESFTPAPYDQPMTFVSTQGTGAILSYSSQTQVWNYVARDGTHVAFEGGPPNQGASTVRGRITSLTRPSGETLKYHYKLTNSPNAYASYRLQSITNNFGYQIRYDYGDGFESFTVMAVHAINNAVTYCAPDADSCGDLSDWPSLKLSSMGMTDSLNKTSTTEDLGGGAYRTTYPGNRHVTVAFDASLRVSMLTTDSGSWRYNYAAGPTNGTLTTTVTAPLGKSITVTGDPSADLVTQACDALQHCTSYAYDPKGRLSRVTAPEGDAIEYDHDDRGNVTVTRRVPKPGSTEQTSSSSSAYPVTCGNPVTCNLPISTIDELGNKTDYTYDALHGGVLSISGAADAQGVRPVTHFSYLQTNAQALDASGQLVTLAPVFRLADTYSCVGADGCGPAEQDHATIGYSGPNALPTSSTSQRGDGAEAALTQLGYDNLGNIVSQDGPLPGAADMSAFVYDAGRRLVGAIDPDPDGAGPEPSRARRITYGADGQVALLEQGTVPGAAGWPGFSPISYAETDYDNAGRKMVDKTGDAGQAPVSFVQYAYDAASRLQCATVRMNPATFAGAQPDACTLGPQGGDGPDRITRYAYDDASRPLSITQGVGTPQQRVLRALTYSADGVVQTETDARGNVTSYDSDGLNRLARIRYPDSANGGVSNGPTHLYAYDAAGQVIGEQLRDGVSTATAYDAAGRPVSATVDGSALTYDSLGRVLTANVPGVALTNGYDSRGNLLSQTGPLGTVTYQYDEADRRTRMTWPDGFFVTYAYDAAGKLTAIHQNGREAVAVFGYDRRDARVSLSRPNAVTTTYGYGAAGGLTTLSHAAPVNGVGFSYGRNAAGQILSRTTSNTGYAPVPAGGAVDYEVDSLNQYSSAGGATLAHNARGDTTYDGAAGYGYDELDRLTSARGATLSYDALGRLFSVGRTRFLYDGTDLIGEYDLSGALVRRYVHGPGVDEPLVAYDGAGTGSRRWLLADERGSVVGSSDAAGSVASTALDDDGRGAPVSRFGFTGQAWLPEAGVYHFKARAYSPRLGRFLQPDPSADPDSPSLYAYAGNDPVNGSDPSGLGRPGLCLLGDTAGCNSVGEVVVTGFRFTPIVPISALNFSLTRPSISLNVNLNLSTTRPQNRQPHRYTFTVHTTCSPSDAFSGLKSAGMSAPLAPAARDGFASRVVLFGGNPISQRVNSASRTITNVTLPGHVFYPGQVTVSVTPTSLGSDITVTGTGSGADAPLNNVIGKGFFGASAAAIADQCAIADSASYLGGG